ncbi:hypothetical protein ALQ79_200053 [Pseudomonas amygdali pv. lachrymans]|nr:hypothetical protein ALQ79_200053 [Pseudomonas amygdali pv. lachrymans]
MKIKVLQITAFWSWRKFDSGLLGRQPTPASANTSRYSNCR